jgi:SAM-dependent methyltransferase
MQDSESSKDVYNRSVSLGYKKHSLDANGTDGIVQQWMVSKLSSDVRLSNVVDAGCGAGRFFPIFQQLGARRVIAVDQSMEMLKQITTTAPIHEFDPSHIESFLELQEKIILIRGQMEQVLSSLRGSMDLAFASFSLCVVPEPQDVLRAMHVALKSGGDALISTNVFVPSDSAPHAEHPICGADLRREALETRSADGVRKDLRLVLHLPGADVPLRDKAHNEHDYAVDPNAWNVHEASLIHCQGLTFVDGADSSLNERYYGGTSPSVVSIQGAAVKLANLCMHVRKR